METRKAIAADNLLLSALCRDVQNLHAENHPDIFKVPEKEDFAVFFFDAMLADSTTSIFIADEAGQALGYVLCKVIDRPENVFTYPMHYLLIDQISVRPVARGKGVGAALLEQAVTLARELDLRRIQLDSWGFNTRAHAFFEKQGFEIFNHRFWKNL